MLPEFEFLLGEDKVAQFAGRPMYGLPKSSWLQTVTLPTAKRPPPCHFPC
jgi:hypothetical protein